MSAKRVLSWSIPLLITLLLFLLFLRSTPPREILSSLFSLPWNCLLLYLSLSFGGGLLRALRFRRLLKRPLPFFRHFLITLVQNCTADLLPARSASLLFYSGLLRKEGIEIEKGSGDFLVILLFDLLSLALFLGLLTLVPLNLPFPLPRLRALLLLLGLGSLGIFFLLSSLPLTRVVSRLFESRFGSLPTHFFVVLKENSRLPLFGPLLLLSLAIRATKYLSLYALFVGFSNLPPSPAGGALFSIGIAATELSSLLPVQGLAGFGTWETAFHLVFSLLAPEHPNPFITGLLIHTVTQLWEYLLGLLSFGILLWPSRHPSSPSP